MEGKGIRNLVVQAIHLKMRQLMPQEVNDSLKMSSSNKNSFQRHISVCLLSIVPVLGESLSSLVLFPDATIIENERF